MVKENYKMMIKKRLAISNILMLLIPIMLIALIAGISLERFAEASHTQLMIYQKAFVNGGAKGFEKGLEFMLYDMKFRIMWLVGIVLFTAVGIVALTNRVLTKRLAKSILIPLDLLRNGSNQIKEGNLDFELKYEGKDEFAQVCSDFNEMRLRLKDLVQTQLRYEEERKELVAGVSHDLRTPVTVIKGYVEGIRDGIADTPEKQRDYLDTIYEKACDLDSLIDSLSIFSKMDMGHYPFLFEKVKSSFYFSEYFSKIKEEFQLKGLEVSFENDCKDDLYIQIDKKEMNRVLVNILENSVKYKVAEMGHVKAHLEQIGSNVVLKMTDDGPGVEPENLSKLFTQFYRTDSSRTNPHEGSGLGLAIAKHIVNAHGGTIIAQNNNGLEMVITLSVMKEED